MKKTAVQWLAEKMMHPQIFNTYIEEALEIEKEQILKAFWNGNTTDCISEQNYALEYYKETYKNK